MNIKLLLFSLLLMMACTKKSENNKNSNRQENPNIFTTQVGNYKVHLLSEGQNQGKTDVLIGASPEMIKNYLPEETYPTAVNMFLIQTGDRNILIDTGLGKELTNNLESLGLKDEDITDIIITHLHKDHIGGLMKNEEPRFPQAYLKISIPEYEYWNEQDKEDDLLSLIRSYPKFSAINPDIFSPDNESGFTLAQGTKLTAIPAYGHTPGHMAILLDSQNEKLLIWADIVHASLIQLPHPQVAVTYDLHPEEAIKSRERLLEYAAENKILIAGMHLPYPGMGYVKKLENNSYQFIPL